MAKIIENSKNFKVIEVSADEVIEKFGGLGICDWCNKNFSNFFYIPVLNQCYCQECYDNWMKRAINHKEDHKHENKVFKYAKKQLDI
jgi:hypothetical protein